MEHPPSACADYAPSPPNWVGSLELEHVVSTLRTELVHIPIYSLDRFVRLEVQTHGQAVDRRYLPALRARLCGNDAVRQVLECGFPMTIWGISSKALLVWFP